MGKSKSWFDLNHDWITGDDLIWVQNIWFGNMWFDLDLISFHVIWFVIWRNDLNLFLKWFVILDCDLIYDLPITEKNILFYFIAGLV